MICDCCRREVEYAKASFWHNDARICGECLAQWRDPDNVYTSGAGDAASVGNYVRLQHGLPPLAAALAILLLTGAPDARASRHCLDQAEAARTWPAQVLVRDGDGCWTHDRRPPRPETPAAPQQAPVPVPVPVQIREATLADRWVDAGMLRLDLPETDPKRASETPSPPGPLESKAARAVRLDRACGHIRGRSCDRRAPRRGLAPAMAGPEGASRRRQRLRLSAHRFVGQQYRKAGLHITRVIEQAMVECPDRGLRPVVGANFSQDGLHMRLHGRLRDPEEPRGLLV